jgi:hypothetical protein
MDSCELACLLALRPSLDSNLSLEQPSAEGTAQRAAETP